MMDEVHSVALLGKRLEELSRELEAANSGDIHRALAGLDGEIRNLAGNLLSLAEFTGRKFGNF